MIESSSELPTPLETRAFDEAKRAAWRAARMREASRAFVTGHVALGVCLPGICIVLGTNAPFVLIALLFFVYPAFLFWAIRRIHRQRGQSLVKVTDRIEVELAANPRNVVLPIIAWIPYTILCMLAGPVLLRRMPTSIHLASLAIFPMMCVGYFVHQALRLALWEYFLFATSIPLAYLPVLLQPEPPAPQSSLAAVLGFVSVASMVLAIVGAASLHHRWEVWSRSLDDLGSDKEAGEVAS